MKKLKMLYVGGLFIALFAYEYGCSYLYAGLEPSGDYLKQIERERAERDREKEEKRREEKQREEERRREEDKRREEERNRQNADAYRIAEGLRSLQEALKDKNKDYLR